MKGSIRAHGASETAVCNVARFLPSMAERNPDVCAVRAPVRKSGRLAYQERSFAQLNAESDAAARLLEARGITRGTRTLLMVRPGLDLIRLTFALFKVGAVPVVIDPGMGLKNFLRCVRQTQPEALVGIPLAQRLSRVFFPWFKSVGARVAVGGAAFARELKERHSETAFPVAPTGGTDLAAVLFTSGSTGAPKGVCYQHGQFEAQVRMIRAQYDIQPGEVDLPMLPIFALFNPAFGMTTVVPEMNPSRPAAVDPARIVEAIERNGVTNSFGSPVLWSKIATYCEEKGTKLPTIRRVLMAGAPVPPQLIRRMHDLLPNGHVHTPYGATEALPVSSISGTEVLEDTWRLTEEGKGTCVGRPLPEVSVRVIRLMDGPIKAMTPDLLLENGQVGEIAVHGLVATQAYDRLPAATAAAKIPDATRTGLWHRMGDLGYFDASGRLWFCGRKAERVQTSAGDLYTDCVEGVFNTHPKVFRTALIGIGKPGEQTPALIIEPKAEHWPKARASQARFIDELRAIGTKYRHTASIALFYFCRKFPVDVRHNAKIHRLTLAKRHTKAVVRDLAKS